MCGQFTAHARPARTPPTLLALPAFTSRRRSPGDSKLSGDLPPRPRRHRQGTPSRRCPDPAADALVRHTLHRNGREGRGRDRAAGLSWAAAEAAAFIRCRRRHPRRTARRAIIRFDADAPLRVPRHSLRVGQPNRWPPPTPVLTELRALRACRVGAARAGGAQALRRGAVAARIRRQSATKERLRPQPPVRVYRGEGSRVRGP